MYKYAITELQEKRSGPYDISSDNRIAHSNVFTLPAWDCVKIRLRTAPYLTKKSPHCLTTAGTPKLTL